MATQPSAELCQISPRHRSYQAVHIESKRREEEAEADLSALAMLTCTAAAWRLGKEIHRPPRPGKLNTWTESEMLFWIKTDLTYN